MSLDFLYLHADKLSDPIGLTSVPRLEWCIEGDEEFAQKSFRILLATSEEKLAEAPDVLDTGFMEGKERFYLPHDLKLLPFTRYYWSVFVQNVISGETLKGPTARFVTASLKRSQWKARVLRTFAYEPLFDRHVFSLRKPVADAFLFAAMTGEKSNACVMMLNGSRIGGYQILPGPTEYMTMLEYGYDIKDLLRETNVFNVSHITSFSGIIKIFYTDGTEETIQTDETWERLYRENYIRAGYRDNKYHRGKYEFRDNTLEPEDWFKAEEAAYDKVNIEAFKNWGPIQLRFCGVRTGVQETIAPREIRKIGSQKYLVDFGTIQSGYTVIRTEGCRGKIRIQYAELVENEQVSDHSYGADALPVTEFIASGKTGEIYSPSFMHSSFRYVQVESDCFVPNPNNIVALFLHSNTDSKTKFSSSDETLNYIDFCSRRSFYSNLVNIPTDCPGRERRGWSGDCIAVAEAESALLDIYNLYDRWFSDLHDNQRLCGWCNVEYPDSTDLSIDIVWPMHIILAPWSVYLHTGDIRFLQKNIDSMEHYADLLFELSEDHLFSENLFTYGDWLSIHPANRPFIGAAFYYEVTHQLARIEQELDRNAEFQKYTLRASEIREAVNGRYLHEKNGNYYYDNNSQSANILALKFRLCPGSICRSVVESVVSDIENRKMPTVGFLANTWLYEILSRNGYNDLAFRLMTDRSYSGSSIPNLVNRLRCGTMPESFTTIHTSLNHAFLGGGPAIWIHECLAGIVPTQPGYREFQLKPYLAPGLKSFSYSVLTSYGTIRVSWEQKKEKTELVCTVPYDTRATLFLNTTGQILLPGTHTFSF